MKPLRALPQSASIWEVAELAPPTEIPGVRSLLLVAEGDTGLARLAAAIPAGMPVVTQLRAAFEAPAPGTSPGRPRAVTVRDAGLLREIGPLLAEADVRGVLARALPAVDELTASLLASAGGPPAPGITTDFGAWRQGLEAFRTRAPWRRIGDDVLFAFTGGALDGAVAVVLGNAGELRGLVLYASRGEHARFLAGVDAGEMPLARSLALHLEPEEELSAAERKACAGVGLALPGGDYPRVYMATPDGFAMPDEDDQRRLLLALDAVVALCATGLEALAEGRPASTTYRRGKVSVQVRGEPPEPPRHLLVQADCAFSSGLMGLTLHGGERREYPSILLKLRKREAQGLAAALARLSRIVLRRGEILAHGGHGQLLGCLVPAGADCDSLVEGWKHGEDVLVTVSSGGSTRPGLRSDEVISHVVVRFERDDT